MQFLDQVSYELRVLPSVCNIYGTQKTSPQGVFLVSLLNVRIISPVCLCPSQSAASHTVYCNDRN